MTTIETYEINGKVYINTKFIMAYFNRTDKQIGRWKKEGMPVVEKKPKELNKAGHWYILNEVISWVEVNINKTKANNSKGSDDDTQVDMENYEHLSVKDKKLLLGKTGANHLDDKKKIEEIIEKEFKNKQHEKDWVRKEKPAQTIKALARTFISLLKNMMITVSKDGENKNQDELFHIMDKYLESEVKKLQNLLKGESKINLYEIQAIIISRHEDGVSIDDMVKKLKDIK